MTLRFPEKNAQIKVHKLVINACTDYFIKQEENGLINDGIYDMPNCFLPELVAPIIRFMYTGRLDLKSQMFTRYVHYLQGVSFVIAFSSNSSERKKG